MTGARIGAEALYARVSEHAAALGVALSPEELAGLAVRGDMGGRRARRARGGLLSPGGQAPRPGHRHAPQAQQASPEGAQDLRGVRLRPHTRLRRRRAAHAAGAFEPAREEEPRVHRVGRNREDAPRPDVREGVLPCRLQDVLPQGHGAEGQAQEGLGIRQ